MHYLCVPKNLGLALHMIPSLFFHSHNGQGYVDVCPWIPTSKLYNLRSEATNSLPLIGPISNKFQHFRTFSLVSGIFSTHNTMNVALTEESKLRCLIFFAFFGSSDSCMRFTQILKWSPPPSSCHFFSNFGTYWQLWYRKKWRK